LVLGIGAAVVEDVNEEDTLRVEWLLFSSGISSTPLVSKLGGNVGEINGRFVTSSKAPAVKTRVIMDTPKVA
jgi:hypothetical protein